MPSIYLSEETLEQLRVLTVDLAQALELLANDLSCVLLTLRPPKPN
jgi:hypothetical protein